MPKGCYSLDRIKMSSDLTSRLLIEYVYICQILLFFFFKLSLIVGQSGGAFGSYVVAKEGHLGLSILCIGDFGSFRFV